MTLRIQPGPILEREKDSLVIHFNRPIYFDVSPIIESAIKLESQYFNLIKSLATYLDILRLEAMQLPCIRFKK